jgi:hypothetical protein
MRLRAVKEPEQSAERDEGRVLEERSINLPDRSLKASHYTTVLGTENSAEVSTAGFRRAKLILSALSWPTSAGQYTSGVDPLPSVTCGRYGATKSEIFATDRAISVSN